MKRWFSDGAFRSILRNAAYLGSGSVASALLGLLALSCAGKGMSPEMFGVLVVIQAYTKAVSDFIKFQTWQFVVAIRHPGAGASKHRALPRRRRLLLRLDIASGVIAVPGRYDHAAFLVSRPGAGQRKLLARHAVLHPDPVDDLVHADRRAARLQPLRSHRHSAGDQAVLQAVGSVISYYFDLGFPGFIVTWYASNLIGGTLFWWFTGTRAAPAAISTAR
ncbi:Inner membrane protein yghQ [Serratia marcescens]|nr:Inner membrane protein yghQ [Serratia marcescens]